MGVVEQAIDSGRRTPADIDYLREAIRSMLVEEGLPVRRHAADGPPPRSR